jgi:NTE family protein
MIMSEQKQQSVALVLASGGARGLAHIGAIQELVSRNYRIHSIAGSSIGSVIGGIYAAGKLEPFTEWILSLSKLDVYRLMDFTLNMGFVKAERVFEEIKKFTGEWQIDELEIDLKIVAVDAKNKKEIVFDYGDLFEAIRASIAYPAVITPHVYQGMFLVDGGVMNPIPVNRVGRKPDDLLVAVDLNANLDYVKKRASHAKAKKAHVATFSYSSFKKMLNSWSLDTNNKDEKESWSYLKLMQESLILMHHQVSELTLRNNAPDVLVSVSHQCANLFDFHKADELIAYGRQQTKMALDKYEASLVAEK